MKQFFILGALCLLLARHPCLRRHREAKGKGVALAGVTKIVLTRGW